MKKLILLAIIAFSTNTFAGDFVVKSGCGENHTSALHIKTNDSVAVFALCNRGKYDLETARIKIFDQYDNLLLNRSKLLTVPKGSEVFYHFKKDKVKELFGEHYYNQSYKVRMVGHIQFGEKKTCRLDLEFPSDEKGTTGVRFKMKGTTQQHNRCKTKSVNQYEE